MDVFRIGFPTAYKKYLNDSSQASDAMLKGTTLHEIFEKQIKDLNNKVMYVDATPKSINEEKVCMHIIRKKEELGKITKEIVLEAYDLYYKKPPNDDDALLRYEELKPYIRATIKKDEVILVDKQFYFCLREVVTSVSNDYLLNRLIYEDAGYVVSVRELIVNWTYKIDENNAVKCKSMIDRLIIEDGGNEYNVYVIDYKTHSKSNNEFEKSYQFWDYDIQGEFYSSAATIYVRKLIKLGMIVDKPLKVIPIIIAISFYDNSAYAYRLAFTKNKLHEAMVLVNKHLKLCVYDESMTSYEARQRKKLLDSVLTFKLLNNNG